MYKVMVVEIETIFMPYSNEAEAAFINLMNFLLLTLTEDHIREGLPRLCKGENDISKYFVWGFGSHHFWVNQRYLFSEKNNGVCPHRLLIVRF